MEEAKMSDPQKKGLTGGQSVTFAKIAQGIYGEETRGKKGQG